jgi:hypothetical protein
VRNKPASRTTGPDRARYYDYGVASAREVRDWYFKARHHLSAAVVERRQELIGRIIRMLSAVIPRERGALGPEGRGNDLDSTS